MAKMQLNREMENALRKLDMSEEKIAELKEKELRPQVDLGEHSPDSLEVDPELVKTLMDKAQADQDVERISPDDLDGVSGGGGIYGIKKWAPEDWRCPCFYNMTYIEGGEFIAAVYENFGHDVTADFCMEYFNCKTRDWDVKLREGGPYYCAVYMWSIAYSCWIN